MSTVMPFASWGLRRARLVSVIMKISDDDGLDQDKDGEWVKNLAERPRNAGKPWNNKDRRSIIRYLTEGKSWDEIAKILGRPSANSVKLQWAEICQKGELVQISLNENQHNYPSIAPKNIPDPWDYKQDKENEDLFDVIHRSSGSIWYSFLRRGGQE